MKTYYYYKIVNRINNKAYIGVTVSPKVREEKHFRELKNNCHHSIKLQNAYNKYGSENFVFEIFKKRDFEKRIEALLYEIVLIKRYKTKTCGYNMTDSISAMKTEKIVEKVKLANQSRVPNILQIDMETLEVVNIFNSLREAERETGIFRSNITLVCNRKKVSSNGYYWAYEKDFDEKWIPKLPGKSIPVAMIDDDGSIIRMFDSAADAARKLNIDRSNIRASTLRGGICNG